MVQFQNLDPFQHRAWRYLNVDETGIDDPAWNAAAAAVIRGLDDAIGLLCELADRRGAAVLVVSDHGFGPCLGRIHVNRILIDAGVARLPGTVGPAPAAGRAGARPPPALGRQARRPRRPARRRSTTSVAAQFPFDWKRTLAFAPHQDTAAMVYLNSAAATRRAPRCVTPRQIDDARAAAAAALAEARHPETGPAALPADHRDRRGLRDRPGPRRLSRPDRPARRALLGPHQARPGHAPGSSPTRTSPAPTAPRGSSPSPAPGIAPGRTLQADLRDVAPTILNLLRPARSPATSRAGRSRCLRLGRRPTAPSTPPRRPDRRPPPRRSSSTRPRSRRSSSSGSPTSATSNENLTGEGTWILAIPDDPVP